ncbi:MAG: glutamine--tRNA ligase/YqeY domain fusion protein [Lentisphaerae bacterium]|jgi:glutaminyl-tRNA synthetase|nr:glutamine--tRNA ligase/YqeY domain fusion protein [Lentisphaerota bacterium]
MSESTSSTVSSDFIRDIVNADIASGKYKIGEIRTRFPPEPNGYLHIGHAKALWIDFGVARDYQGKTLLRMDDTNPVKEDVEYVESIKEDIRWLGFEWDGEVRYASDYFEWMYELAELMIEKGLAYVDDQTAEEIRITRGTLTEPGTESPWRNRSVAENMDLFRRMRAGEFRDGEKVLRAKIDMTHPNMNFRDPVMYRILHAHHHRTGDKWCIYPMYDWAHGLEDSYEGITHSLCTLEFEIHRPLYEWFLEQLPVHRPQQIEFSRLNLTYTVMSKRKLLRLVQEKHVNGWDDPRMPTICGLRRRGYTASSILNFLSGCGVTKFNGITDITLLENSLRDALNKTANRYMGVLDPLKVVLTNYPEGRIEMLEAVNNPEDDSAGTRQLPFGRELYIDRDDFREVPPPKYHRLAPGSEVRLRWGYFIKCEEVIKDASGEIVELRCTYDPATRGGMAPDGRKVKGTIQWVEASNAIDAEVRQYDRLFLKENPDDVEEGKDFLSNLNPSSLTILTGCKVEPALAGLEPEDRFQLERIGYFCADRYDYRSDKPVFNLTVNLKDTWSKIEKAHAPASAKKEPPKAVAEAKPEGVEFIGIEDFGKLQLKVAKVVSAERVEGADKLLKLQVDCGEIRQIVAGVATVYSPDDMVGKLIIMVTNLQPATIRGVESNGMLLAAKRKGELRLLTVDGEIAPGASVG